MKEIVLKLYEFDELSKDSQERVIERERWNVMEQCMDAYDIDYKRNRYKCGNRVKFPRYIVMVFILITASLMYGFALRMAELKPARVLR